MLSRASGKPGWSSAYSEVSSSASSLSARTHIFEVNLSLSPCIGISIQSGGDSIPEVGGHVRGSSLGPKPWGGRCFWRSSSSNSGGAQRKLSIARVKGTERAAMRWNGEKSRRKILVLQPKSSSRFNLDCRCETVSWGCGSGQQIRGDLQSTPKHLCWGHAGWMLLPGLRRYCYFFFPPRMDSTCEVEIGNHRSRSDKSTASTPPAQ